jgi:hypothetical protein
MKKINTLILVMLMAKRIKKIIAVANNTLFVDLHKKEDHNRNLGKTKV